MPAYFGDMYWLYLLWPMAVFIALLATALAGVLRWIPAGASDSTSPRTVAVSVATFALVGMVTGFMTGLSREPIVGAVLPAVLSLIGGLGIYLTGRSGDGRASFVISGSVAALALSILVGALWGAKERDHWQRTQTVAAQARETADYLVRQAEVEAYVRMHRRQLGLPETPPTTPRPALQQTGTCAGDTC